MDKYKVAILVLGYNSQDDLDECFSSLSAQTYKNTILYLLDNNSCDNSIGFIRQNFPKVNILDFKENLGYAGANNWGMEKAFSEGVDFCLVINADIKADKKMIENLVATYSQVVNKKDKVGLIQPVILLYDNPKKINTIGNSLNYLGFGFCKDFDKEYSQDLEDQEISSVSGACMLVSKEYYEDVGKFDEDFFMYNEDQNYSWRGLLKGYKHFLSSGAVMYHKYNFSRHGFKIYHSEKNRLMMLLENYELKTLFLLIPVLILNEFVFSGYTILQGWFFKKVKSYFYVLGHLGDILKKRKLIQKSRKKQDKEIISNFEYSVDFGAISDSGFKTFIIKGIVNPLYALGYKILLILI